MVNGTFRCTRPVGHVGHHVATGIGGAVFANWLTEEIHHGEAHGHVSGETEASTGSAEDDPQVSRRGVAEREGEGSHAGAVHAIAPPLQRFTAEEMEEAADDERRKMAGLAAGYNDSEKWRSGEKQSQLEQMWRYAASLQREQETKS